MATADTAKLGEPHEPKEESIRVFMQIEHELKRSLVRLRHDCNKHEPEYFAAVEHLSDAQLTAFGPDDLTQVRVAVSAYGVHVFGKVRIPSLPDEGPAYIHFRAFTSGPGDQATLHSIHTEDREEPGGGHTFRAVFTKDDELEWFDT
ncbi:4480523c-40e3-4f2f-a75e-6bc1ece8c85b [Thermothielavioides terrestris]|uniref:4480523c-40e3-4f2f-a75e-6bc1ece8c85b n=1 Tax=Thermothielavioides terrestris TaxID=2587410 RepID=A0A446B8Z2_9PEZI|nr:4480523c-40e3-4f2f-a75e-6bc1ece8c85b [Thermothielavioides terrestris]